jgi:hypothetical protein
VFQITADPVNGSKLACKSEETLREIAGVLNELGQHLATLEIYRDSIALDVVLLDTLFNILVDLLLGTVDALRHFRNYDSNIQKALEMTTWLDVRKRFAETPTNINSKIQQLEKTASAHFF